MTPGKQHRFRVALLKGTLARSSGGQSSRDAEQTGQSQAQPMNVYPLIISMLSGGLASIAALFAFAIWEARKSMIASGPPYSCARCGRTSDHHDCFTWHPGFIRPSIFNVAIVVLAERGPLANDT